MTFRTPVYAGSASSLPTLTTNLPEYPRMQGQCVLRDLIYHGGVPNTPAHGGSVRLTGVGRVGASANTPVYRAVRFHARRGRAKVAATAPASTTGD